MFFVQACSIPAIPPINLESWNNISVGRNINASWVSNLAISSGDVVFVFIELLLVAWDNSILVMLGSMTDKKVLNFE